MWWYTGLKWVCVPVRNNNFRLYKILQDLVESCWNSCGDLARSWLSLVKILAEILVRFFIFARFKQNFAIKSDLVLFYSLDCVTVCEILGRKKSRQEKNLTRSWQNLDLTCIKDEADVTNYRGNWGEIIAVRYKCLSKGSRWFGFVLWQWKEI